MHAKFSNCAQCASTCLSHPCEPRTLQPHTSRSLVIILRLRQTLKLGPTLLYAWRQPGDTSVHMSTHAAHKTPCSYLKSTAQIWWIMYTRVTCAQLRSLTQNTQLSPATSLNKRDCICVILKKSCITQHSQFVWLSPNQQRSGYWLVGWFCHQPFNAVVLGHSKISVSAKCTLGSNAHAFHKIGNRMALAGAFLML